MTTLYYDIAKAVASVIDIDCDCTYKDGEIDIDIKIKIPIASWFEDDEPQNKVASKST